MGSGSHENAGPFTIVTMEKESVFRMKRAKRCLSVVFHRSL
jgi:hypothetical protein